MAEKKDIQEIALRYETRSGFAINDSYYFRQALCRGWLDEVCSHMDGIAKWTSHTIKIAAKCFDSRREFSRRCGGAYNAAIKKGILDDVCAHMPKRKKRRRKKWDYEEVLALAKKYSTQTEFRMKHISAYNAALENGWLDEVCTHMKPKLKWTFEAVAIEAKQYSTRTSFFKGNPSAYMRAREKGWLNKVCTHMSIKLY